MNEPQRTERRIEIVHESLLTKWPRLVHWQTQDAEGAQLRDELRQAAQVWEQHGRSQDFLWTGTAFREYQLWRERYPGGLSAVEADFTQAMEVGARRRRRRRRAAIATLLAAAAVVVVVTSVLWQRSESSRKHAEAAALRAEASKLVVLGEREVATYPTGALAYAIKSLEVADTEAGRLLALRVLQQAPVARIAEVGLGDADGGWAFNLDFSPDGEWVATGGFTKSEVLHRDGRRRLLLGEYTARKEGFTVRFTPRGDALVANLRGEVRMWSIPEGHELRRGQIDQGLWSSLVMGDDEFVTLTALEGRTEFRSWPLGEGEPRRLGTTEPFGRLEWNVSRGMLAFGRNAKLLLQSLENLDEPPRVLTEDYRALPEKHSVEVSDNVRAMALSSDGNLVAVKEPPGTIRIWATASHSGTRLRDLEGDEELRGLWFGHQSRWLAETGWKDGQPQVWLWDFEAPPGAAPIILRRGDTQLMNEVAFEEQAQWLATAHATDVALWWLGGDYPRVFHGEGTVSAVVFTPDGQSLVSSSNDGTVRVWPLVAGSGAKPKILLRGDLSINPGIAIDPRGRKVAVAGGRGRIHLVPLDGSPATLLEGFSDSVELYAVAFGADGRLLAAAPYLGPADEKVIRVFDLETGAVRVLGPVPGVVEGFGGIQSLHFAAPDRILAAVVRGRAPISPDDRHGIVSFDLNTGAGTVLAPWPRVYVFLNNALTGGVGITTTDSEDESSFEPIRFRLDGSEPEPFRSHGSLFSRAAFDPSDRLLATDSEHGILVGEFGGQPHLLLGESECWSIVFSPDGRWLASPGTDGTIRVWRVPDLSEPPLHTLPLDTLLAKLRTHTNLRAVSDPASPTGYRLEVGPFPGWAEPPEW